MRPIIIAVICLAGFSTPANEGTTRLELYRLDEAGVAIDGYSPVSYFQRDRAESGSAEFAVVHDGITYHLTDEEQVALFHTNPDRYVPAHGGWCSLMLSGSGQRTPANPESFKIVNDRLLLFWHGEYQGQTISGLGNWASKTDNNPAKERKRLRKADKTWGKILAGKKTSPVVLFNDSDRERISEHHLEQMK